VRLQTPRLEELSAFPRQIETCPSKLVRKAKCTGFEQFALDVFRQFQIFGYLFNDFTRRSGTAKLSERIEQGTEVTHELGTLDAF